MNTQQAISMSSGVIVSLMLQLVPPLRRWWEHQRGKVLLLLVVHIGSAVGIWVLNCWLHIPTGVYVSCTPAGLAQIGWAGSLGFVSNQTTYGLTNYAAPATAQWVREHPSVHHRVQALAKTIRREE